MGAVKFLFPTFKEPERLEKDISFTLEKQKGKALSSPIIWNDKILASQEEAEIFLKNDKDHSGQNLAVKFREQKEPPEEKLQYYKVLTGKVEKYQQILAELNKTNYLALRKEEFIECPHCKSQINRQVYCANWTPFPLNVCPVCQKNILTSQEQKKISQIKKLLQEAQLEACEEFQRQQDSMPCAMKWLVIIND